MELEVSKGDKIEGHRVFCKTNCPSAGRNLSSCLVGLPKASCAGSWRDAI